MNRTNIIVENVSRETLALVNEWAADYSEVFDQYSEILLWWNKKVNLVSRDMSAEELLLHIKHCLLLVAHCRDIDSSVWVDTGTGGGLPGIPFAIVFSDRGVVLNDVVEKKGIVLKDMTRKLSLQNVRVEIMDVGKLEFVHPFSVMTKHAFKIHDLLDRLAGKPWQHLVFLKGADYIEELAMVDATGLSIRVVSLESVEPSSFFKGKYLLHLCQTV